MYTGLWIRGSASRVKEAERMSDMVLDAAALEDQEALLTDDLFEKDDSA